MRISALRRLIVLATPLWVQTRVAILPAWLARLVALAVGITLTLALAYGVMEHVWSRRVRGTPSLDRPYVHLAWTRGAELRSALLYAMSALALLPWWATAFGLRLPLELLSPVTRAWMVLLLALACAELLSHSKALRVFRRARGRLEP